MDLITLCFMSLGPGPRKSSGPLPLAGAEEVTSPQTDTSLSVLKSELGHTLLFALLCVHSNNLKIVQMLHCVPSFSLKYDLVCVPWL